MNEEDRAALAEAVRREHPEMSHEDTVRSIGDMEAAIVAFAKFLVPLIETVGAMLLSSPFAFSAPIYRDDSALFLLLAASVCDACELPALAEELRGSTGTWRSGTADDFADWAADFRERSAKLTEMARWSAEETAPTAPIEAFVLNKLAELAEQTIADNRKPAGARAAPVAEAETEEPPDEEEP